MSASVTVKTVDGKSYKVEYDPKDSVKQLKEKIAKKLNESNDKEISADSVIPILAGKQLSNDNEKVADLDLNKGSTIVIAFRLKGWSCDDLFMYNPAIISIVDTFAWRQQMKMTAKLLQFDFVYSDFFFPKHMRDKMLAQSLKKIA